MAEKGSGEGTRDKNIIPSDAPSDLPPMTMLYFLNIGLRGDIFDQNVLAELLPQGKEGRMGRRSWYGIRGAVAGSEAQCSPAVSPHCFS